MHPNPFDHMIDSWHNVRFTSVSDANPKKISEAESAAILRLYNEGMRQVDIATHMRRSIQSVRKSLVSNGVTIRRARSKKCTPSLTGASSPSR